MQWMEDLDKLERWLVGNASVVGRTLPVPLAVGGKSPLVTHAPGRGPGWRWTWETLWEFRRTSPKAATCGWGLLLDGLCVLDADTAEAVEQLESLGLAELTRCPKQLTSKGRHYFFARPAWADAEGYWDGARQVSGRGFAPLEPRPFGTP